MRNNSIRIVIGLLVFCISALGGPVAAENAAESQQKRHTLEIQSKLHTLQEAIPSMHGPVDTQFFELTSAADSQLLWLKSTRVDIVDAAGEALSPEHLCHSNLFFTNFREHQDKFSRSVTSNQKFVDINQGQLEVEMPDGFGVPLMSTESLRFHSMVINPTENAEPITARVKTTFEYLRDDELVGPIKALSQRAIRLRVPIVLPKGHEHHGDSSHPDHASSDGLQCDPEQETYQGQSLATSATKSVFKTDSEGPIWSVHWLVPPGRHEYRYKTDNGVRIPFKETTVHMITSHVHPYAESIELHDLTAGKRIFHADVEHFDQIPGISNIPHYSSVEGLPVYQDHEYEIVVVYNNTTDADIDAMALVYLYYWDRNFKKPATGFRG